ncbi:MAG: cyanophycinase [Chitinophagaceae bacterium]|nr:cyanophycinase [Chitinophagaceae bacterium]MCZ2397536.1 cyanophycinase [Chitinophagales bacterium]
MMRYRRIINIAFTISLLLVTTIAGAQKGSGSLFIIGGGERSAALMQELVNTASLAGNDYIVVLTMASGVPDESYEAVSKQLGTLCKNVVTKFHFTQQEAKDKKAWIDSVANARLIYIVGGDQNRFMDVVRGTPLYEAMHTAFNKGATVAGTSAGAAVMSQIMITGEERDKKDNNNFREIRKGNVITSEGMGFVSKAIIDQHFVKRSRYNRLLSVLGDHPDKMVIGVDESTAVIVKGKRVRVVGESQVVVVSHPRKVKVFNGAKVAFQNARLALYSAGDTFKLK